MEVNTYHLAPFVIYDDYDEHGYLLDLKQGILEELDEHSTRMLSAVLKTPSAEEAITALSSCLGGEELEANTKALLTRLQEQRLLESGHRASLPRQTPVTRPQNEEARAPRPVTVKQRLRGAGHILVVLNELRKVQGLFRAYQYVHQIQDTMAVLPEDAALRLSREEYWLYRLVTSLFERRIAHQLGQERGAEGLCMIRAFALCVYLLSLGVPAQVVIARPKYGSRSGFKLHLWTELHGKPLNEAPNIRDRFRVLAVFPS